jgi:hypothetical protein
MKYLYNAVNPWWEGKHFDVGIGRDIYAGGLPERLGRNEQIISHIFSVTHRYPE